MPTPPQKTLLDSKPRTLPSPEREGFIDQRNDSLREYVARVSKLEPLGNIRGAGGWYHAKCVLPGCEDLAQSLYVFSDGNQEAFECYECGRDGGLEEFATLMNSNGAALLQSLAAFVRRYVVLSDEQATIIALWVVHTHAFDAADATPYLNVFSAEKRSGKTRLLEVLSLLAARSWLTGRVTAAVLVRKVAAKTPALLLDESDAAFKSDREYAEALRGILNSGFRRSGVASLCVQRGREIGYADFPVYCPKAIAGIGKLPDTVADRSVPIELRRRRPGESVARFRIRKAEREGLSLRDAAAAWAEANIERLSSTEPELPDELDDRAQDIIEPLLAIADEVGGEWPQRAREAAVMLLNGEEREDTDSLGVRLLRDVRTVFEDERAERLPTNTTLEKLHELEEAPWGSLRGEPLDARGLARLLKPYGVKPKKLRERDGERTFRGYERTSFEDAWARYAPETPENAEQAEHPEHKHENPHEQRDSSVPDTVPHNGGVPEQKNHVEHEKPHEQRGVPHVPLVPANPDTRKSTAAVAVDSAEACIHNYPAGEGCYLCDPNHPAMKGTE